MGGFRSPPRKLLIPILDMFNHAAKSPHNFAGQVGGDLKVVAGGPISAGDEVCITYGNGMNGNDHFAGDYGFIDPTCVANDRKLLQGWAQDGDVLALTGRAEDEAMLAEGNLRPNEELAVRFRIAMKRASERL